MSTTTNMNITIPEPLVTPGPTYASQINEAIDVIDEHDHVTGRGKAITPNAMSITTDIPMNSQSLANTNSVKFKNNTGTLVTTNAIYTYNGDLYFVDNVGNQVRLTASGVVNVSGVGGITGLDSFAALTYSTINKEFTFTRTPGVLAKIASASLKLYDDTGASVNAVTLRSNISTNSYEVIMPTVAPTNTQLWCFSTSGQGVFKTLQGTTNQITVTHNASNITLSLPSVPYVNNIKLSDITPNTLLGMDANSTGTGVGYGISNTAYNVVLRGASGDINVGSISATGNISVTGSVDGRDVSVDGAKLDTITSGTYTPTVTNVSGSGTISVSNACYMKVGNVVSVSMKFTSSGIPASNSRRVYISLPYTANNNNAAAITITSLDGNPNVITVYQRIRSTLQLTNTAIDVELLADSGALAILVGNLTVQYYI